MNSTFSILHIDIDLTKQYLSLEKNDNHLSELSDASKQVLVTIVTITQASRINLFDLLLNNIQNQTYKNILEWIIVYDEENYLELLDKIQTIQLYFNIKLIKIPSKTNNLEFTDLGSLKNIANANAQGDIIIWMDDDDYYFPNYINSCIDKLMHSHKLLVGSNTIYVYDVILNKLFKMANYKHIFGYKKNYLITHKFTPLYKTETENNNLFLPNKYNINIYDSFTNNFSVEIEELLSDQIYIKFSHNQNKLFKKHMLLGSTITPISDINNLLTNVLDYLIPTNIFNLYYKHLIYEFYPIDYDIIYLTGGFCIVWDPEDTKLGGSEQAIVQLSENWIKLNKKVVVYGNFNEDKILNGVHYIQWVKFPFHKKLKTVILWRRYGILLALNNIIKCDKLIIDFHDNFFTINDLDSKLLNSLFNKVNVFNVKSNYHKDCFIKFLEDKNILKNVNINVIPNGIRIENFKNYSKLNNTINREPYRFCYCSSYDRGLETILEKVWPCIYKEQPLAELHVYYGMDYIFDDNFKNKMHTLLNQKGVTDHGRQPMEVIIKEKYLSTFHLYLNTSIAEIDCISIKESLVTGCIPIISTFGVFQERDGLKFPWDPSNNELCNKITMQLIQLMNNYKLIEKLRNKLLESDTIINWLLIAEKWLNL
jgi:hypothetical protein